MNDGSNLCGKIPTLALNKWWKHSCRVLLPSFISLVLLLFIITTLLHFQNLVVSNWTSHVSLIVAQFQFVIISNVSWWTFLHISKGHCIMHKALEQFQQSCSTMYALWQYGQHLPSFLLQYWQANFTTH